MRHLADRREIGHEDPAWSHRRRRVLHHPPRLRQVEHDPVEPGRIDPVVGVADLDVIADLDLGAEEGEHVGPGPIGEVLTDLVAGHVGARSQQRHRERARADARLEHACAGEDVAHHEDGTEVLRIHDLRASRHLQHDLGQRRPHCGVARPAGRPHNQPLLLAEDVVVVHRTGVGVELAPVGQRHEIAAALAVEQEHAFAGAERTAFAHCSLVAVHGTRLVHRRVRPSPALLTNLQKAQTSAVVGAPHDGHG